MIYAGDKSGTFMIENDMRESKTITIGYKVDGVNKERVVSYQELPLEIKNDLVEVTNKIARFIEEKKGA